MRCECKGCSVNKLGSVALQIAYVVSYLNSLALSLPIDNIATELQQNIETIEGM